MPVCEMCGMDSPKAKRVFLEGTLLMLCPKCSKFGQEQVERDEKMEPEKMAATPIKRPAPYTGKGKVGVAGGGLDSGEVELADDYHKRISSARNKLGLTQEELGRKINERKSVIAKLESKQLRPNDKLIKKLEKVLSITLMEKVSAAGLNIREQKRGFTIGDMIKMNKK
jgi:putative transcription factor